MGMELKASDYVRAKLRQAFCLYEGTMDPVRALMASSWAAELVCGQLVRGVAKSTWGEDKPPGKPDPRWLIKCRQCLGYAMKEFVSEERGWDAYIIGTIQMAHLRDFLPDVIRDDDAACEMHRCV